MEFKGSIEKNNWQRYTEGLISLMSLTVKLLEGLAPICHGYQQNYTAVTKRLKQLCVQRSTSAVNVTLLAFCCWPPCCGGAVAAGGLPLSINICCTPGARQQIRRMLLHCSGRQMGLTDARTPDRYIDGPLHIHCEQCQFAASVFKINFVEN